MTDSNEVELEVRNNPGELRYEIFAGDELAGFTTYTLQDGAVAFRHAEVFPQWEGRGVGSRLAKEALDDVVESGKVITPLCPFIVDFVSGHPSYLPHVDERHRRQIEAAIATEPEAG
ncbi:MAG: N-acetyltransferase [Frankiaceae bacterium]|nr:N-acetyltransferase [Frankiaceae bacterium]